MEDPKIVNPLLSVPDMVGTYNTAYTPPTGEPSDYHTVFNNLLSQNTQQTGTDFPVVPASQVNFTGRFPLFFPGRDNEEMYAQAQGGFEKAYNGVAKATGLATATFINGTAGVIYGIGKSIIDKKFESYYNNPLTNELNDWTNSQEDKYAHYRTLRERDGSWWEPANLFTGNFLWDNIVKNLGFSVGAMGAGFAWGGALKAIGLTGKLVGMGSKMAEKADDIIAKAMLLPKTERLGATTNELLNLWNGAKSSIGTGLTKIDRAIVAVTATAGEAGLESLMNSKQFREEMVNEFKKTHGYAPTKEDMEIINEQAGRVGNWTFAANSALLSATNYIQLPKIFSSSFQAEKSLANTAFREGKYVSTLPEKGFGKLFHKTRNVAQLFFNTAEAFEEGAQFAIQTGTQNYFDRKLRGEETSAIDDGILYGIKQTTSTDEGWLNIAIGGLSGAMMTSGAFTLGYTGKIKERGVTGYGGEEKVTRNITIAALNSSLIKDKLKEAYSSVKTAESIQQDREATIKNGDVLESKDLEFDYAHTFISTRLKHNAKEFINAEIGDLMQEASTEEGFSKLKMEGYASSTDTRQSFLARLDKIQRQADVTEKLYKGIHLKYDNVAHEETIDGKKKLVRTYPDDVIDKLVYANMKFNDYEERIPQVSESLIANGISVIDVLSDVLIDGKTKEAAIKESLAGIDALKVTDDEKSALKTNLQDVIELSLRRENFLDEYKDIKDNPKKWAEKKEKIITPEELEELDKKEEETVELETPKGKKKYIVGETYFLGSVVDYDKNGLEKPVEIPEFRILKDNGDTIDIITSKGEVKTISKDVFKKYHIGSLSAIKDDDNANYFYQHRNEKFEFNFGKDKDGKSRTKQGRIEYKDGKLFFVYTKYVDRKTGKPVLAHMEISREQFFPKGDFKQPMIRKIGAIETKEQAAARERLTDEKKRKEDNKKLEESTKKRNTLLAELRDDLIKQQADITANIEKAKIRLKNVVIGIELVNEDIESPNALDKRIKNGIGFKKSIRKYITAANNLLNEKEQLESTIIYLKQQEEDIELSIAYVDDISHYGYEASPDIEGFTKEIEDQLSLLEETKKEVHNQINILEKFLVGLNKTIDKLFDAIRSFVAEFEEKYPKAPNAIIGQEWVDFIKANPNFLKLNPKYKEDLKTLDDIISETEELEINPKEKYSQVIKDEVESLQKELKELESQTNALKPILEKFKPYAEQAKQQKLEEEKLSESGEAAKVTEKSMTSGAGIRNADLHRHDKEYEPEKKKIDKHVVTSTIATDDGKPHQSRANLFGSRLSKFDNVGKICGIWITSTNEHLLIPGLVSFLKGNNAEVDENQTIALVMVEKNDETGELSLIGVDGKPLKEGDNPLEKAIFQVKPDAKLKWDKKWSKSGEEEISMFRKTTPDDTQKSLREQYAAWREKILEKTKIANEKDDLFDVMEESVKASFGIPEYVMKDNNTPDYSTRTSVEEAKLVSETEIKNQSILDVPTTNDVIDNGTVRFAKVLGRVFINFRNILIPLQNRKLNKKEATVVYKVIHRLSTLSLTKGGLESEEAETLFSYLRSIVYYRVPANEDIEYLGRNNIFIKKDPKTKQLTLYIADDKSYTFKPSALVENSNSIIEDLQSLFMNVNSHKIKQIEETYTEIIDIKDDGEIVSNSWDNYQTYLLSSKTHNGSKRNNDEIPLSTWVRPIVNEDDTNRHGIYFYTENSNEEFVYPEYTKPTKKSTIVNPKVKAVNVDEGIPEDINEPVVNIDEEKSSQTEAELKTELVEKLKKSIFDDIIENQPTVSNKKVDEDEYSVGSKYTLDLDTKTKTGTNNIWVSPKKKKIHFLAESNVNKDNYLSAIKIRESAGDFPELLATYTKTAAKPVQQAPKAKPAPSVDEENDEEAFHVHSAAIEELAGDQTISDNAKEAGAELTPEQIKKARDKKKGIRGSLRERKNGQEAIAQEDWNKIDSWLKKNFPNIPLYRVKNILTATNGKQAWGMFKDGALYLYRNAEVGTIYHEVFHGIWQMMTTAEERGKIFNEFKQRGGSFYDVKSEKTIKYSDATIKQAEEKMAEEFRDYVHEKKIPPKPNNGRPWIVKLFSDIVNIVKTFFTGEKAKSAVEQLFSNINTGGYKSFIPYESSLNFAHKGVIDIEDAVASEDADYRLNVLSDRQRADVIEHMTWLILRKFIKDDKSLFTIPDIKKSEIYPELKQQIFDLLEDQRAFNAIDMEDALEEAGTKADENEIKRKFNAEDERLKRIIINVDTTWQGIVDSHGEHLLSYGITFDENDVLNIEGQDTTGRDDHQDARKIDSFRKANSAMKILLATIPKTEINEDGEVEAIPTSIGGVSLIPASQTIISLWNKLSHSVNIDDMMRNLHEMAKNDVNYRALYSRLMKKDYDPFRIHTFDSVDTTHGAQLLSAFWNIIKKQSPSVQNIFILDNNEVVVGPASLSSSALQFRDEYEKSIVMTAKDKKGKGFFKFDEKSKKFLGNPASLKDESGRVISINGPEQIIGFLNKLGIQFTRKEINYLKTKHARVYAELESAVNGIKTSIVKAEEIVSFTGKALDIKGNLLKLGIAKSVSSNPQFDSTFFNVVGERMQTYIGPNAASNLFDFLSSLKKFNKETVEGTQYEYLSTDVFAQGSNIMERKYDGEGNVKPTGKDLLEVGYVGGIVNSKKGKNKEASKLTYIERLIQEINLNLQGWYLNLIPGDASIEWMVNMGNAISLDSIRGGMGTVHKIFGKYFISEFNLAKDNRKYLPDDKKHLVGEMRFFKEIISAYDKKLYDKIMALEGDGKAVYESKIDGKLVEEEINKAIDSYVKKASEKTGRVLTYQGVLSHDGKGFTLKDVDLPSSMSEEALNNQLTFLTVNYMIANIEMHKLLYSDPYQYSDELKRIKSFLSPRQAIVSGSLSMNKVFNNVWNKGFAKKDIGHTDFIRDYFRTITFSDIRAISSLPGYKEYDETDGSGVISFKAYRNFRIRAGSWHDADESQYRHDMEYERLAKSGSSVEELAEFNKANPKVQSAYTPLKPIVSGNKANGRDYNDIVLDKYALYPLSYRVISDININGGKTTSNAIALYDKMQKQDIDYAVFKSGRKVGSETLNTVYDKDGNLNASDFKGIVKVPFSIMSLQTEVPAKEGNNVTRGSQVTKLITMDFMEAGVPIDFNPTEKFPKRYADWYELKTDEERAKNSKLFKEIKNNQEIIEALMEDGYTTLLSKLGIKETIENGERKYSFSDFSKAVSTLKDEMLKREVNDNLIDAINSFEKGTSLLESTPAYQQVRNILYSIVDRLIVSPKMPGGLKVQIPVSFMEDHKIKQVGKKGYESSELGFYSMTKDGKKVNVCEMMLPRWFKSDMSDKELLDYLNNTDEGKKILRGIAFRIPTQKQNSIDVFVIKQFLPREFGDAVVIPSELVQKAGSDFDIDKLSIYLKNVFQDVDGNIKMVPAGLSKQQLYDAYDRGDFLSPAQKDKLEKFINKEREVGFRREGSQTVISAENILLRGFFPEYFTTEALTEAFIDEVMDKGLREMLVSKFYKESLENAYIESSDALISHPLNYDQLIKPNSAKQLKDLAGEIAIAIHNKTFDYQAIDNMLDRAFMSRLRHAFVSGKNAIAIAAVSQTNHSLNQRQPMVIDPSLLGRTTPEDQIWLGDGEVKFARINRIRIGKKMLPTLSMVKNAIGEHISDIIAQFIDGYVDISKGPWIMELGASPNVAPTFLFLVKLGVPVNDVAYFMNQPLIRHYLKELESSGYVWLFNDNMVESAKLDYATKEQIQEALVGMKDFQIPSEGRLKQTISKSGESLSKEQIIDQLRMLDEFLKYAKMATHLFNVTQATNYDTATFNDPLLIWKKQMQMEKANKTLISSAEELLKNSFIGRIPGILSWARSAISEILISDQKKVRTVLQTVLTPYIDMSDRDFLKIAKKATADIFDYAVQIDGEFNEQVKELFDDGIVSDIAEFVNKAKKDKDDPLHDNYIINILEVIPSIKGTPNSVNNIKIRGTENKIYDQNNIIYAFRQIREVLGKDHKIYKGLINVAIVQSGLSPSSISYTSLIPFEDFAEIYNKTLSKLEKVRLQPFIDNGIFYRNNWNNDDIVSHLSAFWIKTARDKKMYNISMEFFNNSPVEDAIKIGKENKIRKENGQREKKGGIPPLVTVPLANKESNEEYIFYSWNLMDDLLTTEDQNDIASGKVKRFSRIFAIQNRMREKGDTSYMKRAMFQRVRNADGSFLMTEYKEKFYVVYKAINALGEGSKANEFYDDMITPSIIDNGLESVDFIEDAEIVDLFAQPNVKKSRKRVGGYMSPEADYDELSKQSPIAKLIEKPMIKREYTPENITSLKPNEVFVFGSNTKGIHGLGGALLAKQKFGAIQGKSSGIQGQSYAIITKDLSKGERSIPLSKIQDDLFWLFRYAESHPNQKFFVTKIGSKLAGYSIEEMRNLFKNEYESGISIPDNIILPKEFEVRSELSTKKASNTDIVNALKKNDIIDKKCN